MDDRPRSDASIAVTLSEEELLGLYCVATAEGASFSGPAAQSDLLARAARRGLIAWFQSAALPWPPTQAALQIAEELAAEETGAANLPPQARRGRDARHAALAALAVAAVVVTVGGYVGHWAWTGFESNGQVWDWMHLLLLPVAFGTFPLWLRFSDRMDPVRLRLLGASLLAFLLLVLAGYLAPLVWTGFEGQTLWDWLTLIVLPVTLTTVRAWPSTGREIRRVHVIAGSSLVIGWIVTVVGGYAFGWTWTGYAGNTLWDWLELLLAPTAINLFVVPALIRLVSGNVAQRAEQERAREAIRKELSAPRQGAMD